MSRPLIDPDRIPPETSRQLNLARERLLEIQARMQERAIRAQLRTD